MSAYTSKPKLSSSKRRTSRISFSTTPVQVFYVENKEEYFDDLFYDQESLADFRYEALMWEAGMVDEHGTPKTVAQSADESVSKYEEVDKMNGSLDFDELLLDELQHNENNNSLQDVQQEKEFSRESIKELRRSIDSADLQWKSTADIFCNLEDWDDSVIGDDDLIDDDLDNPFSALNVPAAGPLTPKQKFEQQRRQLSSHKKNKQKQQQLEEQFGAFNLKDDDDNGLVFESSSDDDDLDDDGSLHSSQDQPNRSQRPAFACEDDSQQSERSVDSSIEESSVVGDTSGRSRMRKAFAKRDSLRDSLKSLSDVFSNSSIQSMESLDAAGSSVHTQDEEEDRRTRLMAKMRGLRESLRSIQDLDDFDSDDDSEWGDDDNEEDPEKTIHTKNLKRSLIGKHKIYSPVPNNLSRLTIDSMDMNLKEMTIPEI